MKEKSIQIFIMIKCQKNCFHCICLSVTLTDFKMGKNYYPQVFWKNINTLLKKKKRLGILLRT